MLKTKKKNLFQGRVPPPGNSVTADWLPSRGAVLPAVARRQPSPLSTRQTAGPHWRIQLVQCNLSFSQSVIKFKKCEFKKWKKKTVFFLLQDYVLKQVAARYHQMGWPTNGGSNEGNVMQASYQTEYESSPSQTQRPWAHTEALTDVLVILCTCVQGATARANHVSLQLRKQTVPPPGCGVHLWLDLQQQEQVSNESRVKLPDSNQFNQFKI